MAMAITRTEVAADLTPDEQALRNRLYIRDFSEWEALRTSSNKFNTLAAPSTLEFTLG